jgi:hypothetical protein
MIVSDYFEDDSVKIGWIQHEVYYRVLADLYGTAKRKYFEIEYAGGKNTQLGKDLREESGFDHRTLQYFHDMIAAQFRMEYIKECGGPLFYYTKDIPDEEEKVLTLWRRFYLKEIERLIELYLYLPRLMLTSATYPNPDKRGVEAEDELFYLLRNEYKEISSYSAKKIRKYSAKKIRR